MRLGRVGIGMAAGLCLYFVVNFGWSHAALAAALNTHQCPAGLYEEARSRVAGFYGSTAAQPILVCLDRPFAGLAVEHGTSRFAPLLPTIIVLGHEGQTADVAAHEFAHAELAERTSVLLRSYRVPTWFDEGLAMQFDQRADYSSEALAGYLARQPSSGFVLERLQAPSQFFAEGDVGKSHYAFAKCTVGQAIAELGKEHVTGQIADLNWQSPWPADTFEPFAAKCRQGEP